MLPAKPANQRAMPAQKRREDSAPFKYAAVEADVRNAARRKPFGALNAIAHETTMRCDDEREGERRGKISARLR